MMSVEKYSWIRGWFSMYLFFVLCSCNTYNDRKLLKEITLLQSKPINYCQNELIHDNMLQEKIKYVIYSDSVDCMSCAINQMDLWNPFLEYSKRYNGLFKFYFILCPSKKDIKSVKIMLSKNSKFNYPVILDTLGQFERLNPHLPKNKALHAFLLDENNNVILVGNPLLNKKIKEMFYRIVEEKLGKS